MVYNPASILETRSSPSCSNSMGTSSSTKAGATGRCNSQIPEECSLQDHDERPFLCQGTRCAKAAPRIQFSRNPSKSMLSKNALRMFTAASVHATVRLRLRAISSSTHSASASLLHILALTAQRAAHRLVRRARRAAVHCPMLRPSISFNGALGRNLDPGAEGCGEPQPHRSGPSSVML